MSTTMQTHFFAEIGGRFVVHSDEYPPEVVALKLAEVGAEVGEIFSDGVLGFTDSEEMVERIRKVVRDLQRGARR